MTREFGSDESIIGQVLNLEGRMRTVVGVTPTEFDFPIGADLWIPLVFDFDVAGARGAHYLVVIGRLDDGRTIEQAQQQLDVVTAHLEQEYPNSNTGWTAHLFPVHGEIVDGARTPLIILSGAVGLVLLIACANVANLFLARNSTRRRELAIRYAIGAGRMRILRQLLAESLLLAVCGGLAGLLLRLFERRMLVSLIPAGVPRLQGHDHRSQRFVVHAANLACDRDRVWNRARRTSGAFGFWRFAEGGRGAGGRGPIGPSAS